MAGTPILTSLPDTVTDSVMLSHITRVAEVFNADAEADGQLAGQMSQLGGGALEKWSSRAKRGALET